MSNPFEKSFLWVLNPDRCGGIDRVIEIARATGMGLCAKWHDGDPSDDGKWDFQGKFGALAAKCLPLRIPLLGWGYCYGDTYGNLLKEAAAAIDFLKRYPSSGYVIDAEIEWENPRGKQWAKDFGAQVLTAVPDAKRRLAYAPFWNMRWHSQYPATEFSAFCGWAMPQVYFALGKRTTRQAREEMVSIALEDFAAYGLPVYPIAEFSAGVGGVADFVDIARAKGIKAWSWWLLDGYQDGPETAYLMGLAGDVATPAVLQRLTALESEVARLSATIDRIKQAFV